MKTTLTAFLCLFTTVLFAQNSEERKLDRFTEVSSSQSIDVILEKGSTNRAVVSTNGDLEDVLTEISGDELKIKMRPNKSYRNNNVKVTITYTENLTELSASSSSSIDSRDLIESSELTVKASSSAKIKFKGEAREMEIHASSSADINGTVQAETLEIDASSSADIELAGTCEILDASVSSSADIEADDLTAQESKLRASSSGSIEVSVKKSIDARASSSGSIRYSGNPEKVFVDTNSGGSVRG